ncbi:MAG: methyltransferase, partial [Dehalococcoidia bacterium]
AAPNLHGVLFDRPEVVEQARSAPATTAAAGQWTAVGGDFLAAVPSGGDVYVLSRVLHDWNDAAATCILTSCRQAMAANAVLLVVEAVLPERAVDQPAATRMDLHMLTLLGGRERTAAECQALLAGAGFRLGRVIPTDSPVGLSVLESVPAPP